MVLKRLLRRRPQANRTTDWFRSTGLAEPLHEPAAPFSERTHQRSPKRTWKPHGTSFVETLVEGDPELEATIRGIRSLRADGRESIRRRYLTLAELRQASEDELAALSGIGRATAAQVRNAAQQVESLASRVKGLRSAALTTLQNRYPSVGALAEATHDDLIEVPGIGPTTAERLVTAARG